MKRRFTVGGAIVGLLCGVAIMALAYIQAPSMPGTFELLLQGVIVGVLALAGTIVGFFG